MPITTTKIAFDPTCLKGEQRANFDEIVKRGLAVVEASPNNIGTYTVSTNDFAGFFERISHGFSDMPVSPVTQESAASSPLPAAIEVVKLNPEPLLNGFNPIKAPGSFTRIHPL